jgi:hypothetical protein
MAGGARGSKSSSAAAGETGSGCGCNVVVRVHPAVVNQAAILTGETEGAERAKFVVGRALAQGRFVGRAGLIVEGFISEEKVSEALSSQSIQG